jgi:O-antigen/teichoic acid export membrane protein
MLQQIKALTKQSLIYGSGHILARSISFLLLPLYTNVFTARDYGVVSLAYAFMGFMAVALHYGLDAALMKWYVPADKEHRTRYLTTAYASYLITTGSFVAIMVGLRQLLAPALLGEDYPRYIIYIAGILACDVLWYVPLLVLRSEERPLTYVIFSLLNVAGSLSLNLLLVLKYHMGVQGVLLSNLIMSGSLVVLTAPVLWRRLVPRDLSLKIWQQLMRFGLPFLPAGIFAMMMELADRYILRALTDIATVGIYSAGYKLGMFMLLVVSGFNMGWHPFFLKQEESPETRRLFARVASYLLAALGFIWILMTIWVPRLVRMDLGSFTFYGPEFWSGVGIVPLIALGYLFDAAYLLQLPGVFRLGQSNWIAVTRGTGALSNILLNFILIPYLGVTGAALATCCSFLLMAVFFYFVNRRLYPLPYEWGRLLRIALLMATIYALYQLLGANVLWDAVLTILFPLGLLLSGFLSARERSYLLGLIMPSRRRDQIRE